MVDPGQIVRVESKYMRKEQGRGFFRGKCSGLVVVFLDPRSASRRIVSRGSRTIRAAFAPAVAAAGCGMFPSAVGSCVANFQGRRVGDAAFTPLKLAGH